MAQNSDPVRIAVIGAGFIADYHINGIRAAGGALVTTLVGRRAERTRERAAQLGVANSSTDIDAVLCDNAVDAVVVATPDATHKQIAIDALGAGKPVLLQKPMAMTSGDCREIIGVADQTGTRLTVSFMHRYFPEIRWLKDKIADNSFGPIHFVRLRNATPGADWADWFFNPDNVAGGVVMQLGVHGIDLTQHLFGPIAEVSAMSKTMKRERLLDDGRRVTSALEDNTLATYGFAAGFNASHEMSFTEVAGCDRFRLEVYFENATVWLRSDRSAAMINDGTQGAVSGWQPVDLPDEPLGQAHHAHWLDVVAGRSPADDTALAGVSTIVVAEHIYRAVRERATLSIAQ
jgi:predicted dehydrogenase